MMPKAQPAMKNNHFIFTTIVDLGVFLVGYYAIAWHMVINWQLLFMVIVVFGVNRYLIKIFKEEAKKEQSNDSYTKPSFPLPINEDHTINQLVSPLYRSGKPTIIMAFHGVLHRNQNESLEFKERFMQIFKSVPDAQVVVSSDWRTDCDEPWLREKLGDDLFSKIVAFTPAPLDRNRSLEVNMFLESKKPTRFVVLDSEKIDIPIITGKIIRTESYLGIQQEHVDEIIDYLSC